MAEEKYMTVEEVAQYLGFGKQTIYNKVHNNEIPYHKIGLKAVRFKKDEIDAWIERQRSSEREYVKKGDRHLLKVESPLQTYDITNEKEFLAEVVKETKGHWQHYRLPFEFDKTAMQMAKDIIKHDLVYPNYVKSGIAVYEPTLNSALCSYLTIFKILKDRLTSLNDELYIDFFAKLKARMIENVKEHFGMPDPDTKEGSNEAYVGFMVDTLANDLLHELKSILVYLAYGKKEQKEAYFVYANRYFTAEAFFALYLEGFCYFVQHPFADYGHFFLKDKTINQLTPSQIEQGIKEDIITEEDIRSGLSDRISGMEADLKALKSIVNKPVKGGRHGSKD